MTKKLCRAGVVAALYATLTFVFAPIAFGPFQVRPAEALCLLPLLFPETAVGLFIGCLLANLNSPYLFFDITVGALTTLIAADCTLFAGKKIKSEKKKIALGGLFPVLLNATILPVGILLLSEGPPSAMLYFAYFGGILLTQSTWVYLLGTPLYLALVKMTKNNK